MDISYFSKINNTYNSSTIQETELYALNRQVNNSFSKNIDYAKVKLNSNDFELLVIKDTQNMFKKKIKSRPGTCFSLGDYVEWSGFMWLIVEVDCDIKTYQSGKMQQCNYLFKWQNSERKIIERWGIDPNASKYAVGEETSKIMTLPTNQMLVFMRLDEDTIETDRGTRFFVDYNKKNPKIYELTRPDITTNAFTGLDGTTHGYTNWIIKEEIGYSPTQEELDNWIVNYKEPVPVVEQTALLYTKISYKGESVLKIGGSLKTFTANMFDINNIEQPINAIWSIESDCIDILEIKYPETNKVTIKVLSTLKITSGLIKLSVTDSVTGTTNYIEIKVTLM